MLEFHGALALVLYASLPAKSISNNQISTYPDFDFSFSGPREDSARAASNPFKSHNTRLPDVMMMATGSRQPARKT